MIKYLLEFTSLSVIFCLLIFRAVSAARETSTFCRERTLGVFIRCVNIFFSSANRSRVRCTNINNEKDRKRSTGRIDGMTPKPCHSTANFACKQCTSRTHSRKFVSINVHQSILTLSKGFTLRFTLVLRMSRVPDII